MSFRLIQLVVALIAVSVFVGLLLQSGGDEERAGTTTERKAPVAPERLLARAPAFSDPPEQGERLEENRPTQLPVTPPSEYPPASPRRALAEFLDAWHDRAWDRMALWTERSWRRSVAEPAEVLRARYGAFRLRGWAFLSRRQDGRTATIEVAVATRGMRPVLRREQLTFELIRPEGGRWGVVLRPPERETERAPVRSLADVEFALAEEGLGFLRTGEGPSIAARLGAPLISSAEYVTAGDLRFALLVFPGRTSARLARDDIMALPAIRDGRGSFAYGHNVVAVMPRRPAAAEELRTIERTLAEIDTRD